MQVPSASGTDSRHGSSFPAPADTPTEPAVPSPIQTPVPSVASPPVDEPTAVTGERIDRTPAAPALIAGSPRSRPIDAMRMPTESESRSIYTMRRRLKSEQAT